MLLFQSTKKHNVPSFSALLLAKGSYEKSLSVTCCNKFFFVFNRHAGDLGNIEADSQGQAEVNITDNSVSLMGEYSVIGRTLEVRLTHFFPLSL